MPNPITTLLGPALGFGFNSILGSVLSALASIVKSAAQQLLTVLVQVANALTTPVLTGAGGMWFQSVFVYAAGLAMGVAGIGAMVAFARGALRNDAVQVGEAALGVIQVGLAVAMATGIGVMLQDAANGISSQIVGGLGGGISHAFSAGTGLTGAVGSLLTIILMGVAVIAILAVIVECIAAEGVFLICLVLSPLAYAVSVFPSLEHSKGKIVKAGVAAVMVKPLALFLLAVGLEITAGGAGNILAPSSLQGFASGFVTELLGLFTVVLTAASPWFLVKFLSGHSSVEHRSSSTSSGGGGILRTSGAGPIGAGGDAGGVTAGGAEAGVLSPLAGAGAAVAGGLMMMDRAAGHMSSRFDAAGGAASASPVGRNSLGRLGGLVGRAGSGGDDAVGVEEPPPSSSSVDAVSASESTGSANTGGSSTAGAGSAQMRAQSAEEAFWAANPEAEYDPTAPRAGAGRQATNRRPSAPIVDEPTIGAIGDSSIPADDLGPTEAPPPPATGGGIPSAPPPDQQTPTPSQSEEGA